MSKKNNDVSSLSLSSSFEERSKHRGQWGNSTEFVLACLGNMVGFGNIWRFPYLVFKNGGGVFVMVYVIALLVIGFPIIFIEAAAAQYSQSASGEVFANIAPIFKGIGYCSVTACALITTYYNILNAWTVFYFVEAFTQKWSKCDQDYNTDKCITIEMAINSTKYNQSSTATSVNENRTSSSDEFYNRYMLNKTDSLTDFFMPQRGLAICLFASTTFAAMCLIKGVETSGTVGGQSQSGANSAAPDYNNSKAVYFTAIYPYVMLVILFIRGVTLKGAWAGIKYYLLPNGNLNYGEVLVDAVVQVFYSIGAGNGNLLMFSSFNRFHSKLLQKIVLITFGDFLSSIFVGFVVFSMVGFIADILGKTVQETVTEGTGLVFIVILEGLTQMPLSTIVTFCFVSMLFFLGIDSLFGCMETVNTFVHDFAYSKGYKINKTYITLTMSAAFFVAGLPMTTRSGIYILNLMDTFSAGMPVLAAAIGECLIIAFVYGTDNFLKDFHFMTGTAVHPYVKSTFKFLLIFVVPWLIIAMFINDFISKLFWAFQGKIRSSSAPYPVWALVVGWLMGIGPVMLIPFFAIHYLMTSEEKTCKEKYRKGTKATVFYHSAATVYGSFDEAEKSKKKHQKK